MDDRDTYRDIIRQGRKIIAAWKADRERFRATRLARWERLGGSLVSDMMATREAAISALDHADVQVREAAINVLGQHWEVKGPEFASRFAKMSVEDPSPEIRSLALVAMSACMRESNDQETGRLLASIVCDESKEMRFREAAYMGLHILLGRSILGIVNSKSQTPAFPENIDWALVNGFL